MTPLTPPKLCHTLPVVNNLLDMQMKVAKKGEDHMELLLALGAFVLVDVLAWRYGVDSRPLPVVKNDPRRDS